jgi:hypothetical protein
MRVFRDESGAEWVVWAVRPGREGREREGRVRGDGERRTRPDRRVAPAPEPIVERRRGGDRRGMAASRIERYVRTLAPAVAQGWLAFQSDTVRRRLSPIPDGWADRTEEELIALCRTARPVPPAVTPVPRLADAAAPPREDGTVHAEPHPRGERRGRV